MSDIVRCSNIVKQVNSQAQSGALFTSDIGGGNGVKTRSCCFCLNRLWAWMKGVTYDKNEVAKSINSAFQGVNLCYLQVSEAELATFCRNINQLNITFGKGSKFNQSLIEVITKTSTHVLQKKPTEQIPINKVSSEKTMPVRGRMDIGSAARSDLRHPEHLSVPSERSPLLKRSKRVSRHSTHEDAGKFGLTVGSRNQFENAYGLNETCSGTTLAFLEKSLTQGQAGINSSSIDEVLDRGLTVYRKGISAKNEQARVFGMSEVDARSTQLHPYNLMSYISGITQKNSPSPAQVKTMEELKTKIAYAIDTSLIPIAQNSNPKRSGMTISFNGKTFALNVEINHGKASYIFFDSHGTSASGRKAYTFKANDQRALLEFISGVTEFISREPDADLKKWLSPQEIRELSKPHDGDNELGFFALGF